MTVRIDNLKELRQAMRAAGPEVARVLTRELKGAAEIVAEEGRGNTKGRIAAGVKPFARGTSVGVRSAHPGAGVHEFAEGAFARVRRGRAEVVSWPDARPAPRVIFKAGEDLEPEIGEDILDAIERAAKATGFL